MRRAFVALRDLVKRTRLRTSLVLGSIVLAASGLSLLASQVSSSGAATTPAPKPPATITAHPMAKPSRGILPGSIVRSSELGVRTFPSAENGFALATIAGATYPVGTVDGGKTWRVDGPVLHIPAANAPAVVTLSGAGSPDTYFAFPGPGGGQLVDVTADGGRRWWQASFPGQVLSVIDTQRTLIAFTQIPVTASRTEFWVYASKDGGQQWKYGTRFGECIIGGCS